MCMNIDHDHSSNVLEEELLTISSTKAGVKVPFPGKLFNMLQQIDLHDTDLAQIVAWQPHGRCFLVRNAQKFEEIILPKFFKMKVYDSFRRQLNLWGFKRISQKTSDYGAYYHKRFLRSKMLLHRNVGLVKGSTESSSQPYEQPDFSSMAAMPGSYCSGATASSPSKVPANEEGDGSNTTNTTLESASSEDRIIVPEKSTLSRQRSSARPRSPYTHTCEEPDFYSMAAIPMADSRNQHSGSPRKPAKRSKKASLESSHGRSQQYHDYEQPDFHSMPAMPPAYCFVPVKSAAANDSGSSWVNVNANAPKPSTTKVVNGVAQSSFSGNRESLSLSSEIIELDGESIDKEKMYYDMVPLPENFPPPSNEEWAELMQVVGRIE
jgi:hypothetical protein